MEEKTISKFQVIGRCTKMQTVSLEEEIKLMDGILYDINFCQDILNVCVNRRSIEEAPASEIIGAILKSFTDVSTADDDIIPTNSYQQSQEFWRAIDKQIRKEQKMERKWKKRKGHPKSAREAEENFECIVENLLRG